MKLSDFLQKIFKDFLIIFAAITIIITILRQIYAPELTFDLKSIYILMGFSLLSAFVGFILYSPHDLSEKELRFRRTIHFFALEILLISLASVFEIVESGSDAVILAMQIAVIYLIVRLLSWKKDKREAEQINEKLKAFKNG